MVCKDEISAVEMTNSFRATDTFVYFGLSLVSTELAGNRYANYVFSGLVEIPSYLLAPFCLDR